MLLETRLLPDVELNSYRSREVYRAILLHVVLAVVAAAVLTRTVSVVGSAGAPELGEASRWNDPGLNLRGHWFQQNDGFALHHQHDLFVNQLAPFEHLVEGLCNFSAGNTTTIC